MFINNDLKIILMIPLGLIAKIWFWCLVFVLLVTLANVLRHRYRMWRITNFDFHKNISVIIPVRNEEHNIETCLNATKRIIGEIIVVNDGSTDNTSKIVKAFQKKNSGKAHCATVRLLNVKKPRGWSGKNYACYQGAKRAKYDIYAFIDADVTANSELLLQTANYMGTAKIHFFSYFVKQECKTFLLGNISPMLNWFLLTWYPSFFQWTQWKIMSVANGQCIMMTRQAYAKVSHIDVKNSVVEDIDLVRLAAKKKLRRDVCFTDLMSCSMYNSVKDAINGFSRNALHVSGVGPVLFLGSILMMSVFYLAPLVLVWFEPVFGASIVLIFAIWLLVFGLQLFLINGLCYPISLVFMWIIGIRSVYASFKGGLTWKGRKI